MIILTVKLVCREVGQHKTKIPVSNKVRVESPPAIADLTLKLGQGQGRGLDTEPGLAESRGRGQDSR